MKRKNEFKNPKLVTEFVKVCRQQNLLNVALFFQSYLSYFLQQPSFEQACLDACAATRNEAVIRFAAYSFKKIYQFLFDMFDSVHPGADDVNINDPAYAITIDSFRAVIDDDASNRLTLLKAVIRYFLLTCQLDSALSIIHRAEQRQMVLEEAVWLQRHGKTSEGCYCQCGLPHVAILQHKLGWLKSVDDRLEKAATKGDPKVVDRLLEQGGAALRAITGAITRQDFQMIMDITSQFDFDREMLVSVLELLARAKLDEFFSYYLSYLQKTIPDWMAVKESLIKIAVENGLVNSTLRLLRDQAAHLSLPIYPESFDAELCEHTIPKECLSLSAILGNIPEKPVHHGAVTASALQALESCNQPDVEKAINEWQRGVEYYYRYIESLIIQDDTDDLIRVLNLYGIDCRLALRGATTAGRVDVLEKLFNFLPKSRGRGLLIDLDDAKRFCAFHASRTGQLDVIIFLRIEKSLHQKKIALAAVAAGNREVFMAHFNRADFTDDHSLEGIVYYLGSAGWSDLLLGLIQETQTAAGREFLFQQSAKGAVSVGNYNRLALLLRHSNFNAGLILAKPSESDLFRLVTLLNVEERPRAIQSFISAAFTSMTQQNFSNRATAIIKAMIGSMKLSFEEAYACSDVGIREWFVQGFRARKLPTDIYLLICSFLLGKEAKDFQPKFYVMMQERCLLLFLHKLYGHQNWTVTEKNGKTYHQQNPDGGNLKRICSEKNWIRLEPYSTRLNRNLFYRPPASLALENKTKPSRELVDKGREQFKPS